MLFNLSATSGGVPGAVVSAAKSDPSKDVRPRKAALVFQPHLLQSHPAQWLKRKRVLFSIRGGCNVACAKALRLAVRSSVTLAAGRGERTFSRTDLGHGACEAVGVRALRRHEREGPDSDYLPRNVASRQACLLLLRRY